MVICNRYACRNIGEKHMGIEQKKYHCQIEVSNTNIESKVLIVYYK